MKNVIFGIVFGLVSGSAMALTCANVDGKNYPVDKEAKDLVAAFKPSTSCDSVSVQRGAKMLNKKIVIVDATDAIKKQVRADIEKRANDRTEKRLIKAGLKK
jgi:hypothetical protein